MEKLACLAGSAATTDGAEAGIMKFLALLLIATSKPAWAHVHAANFDFFCTTSDTLPGLTLLPFLLLVGVGAVRAILRHRKDR